MDLLKNFNYEGAAVRTVSRDGEPWFVAADICRVLEVGNPSQAVSRLESDEKDTLISNEGRQVGIINEPGLYSLILGSRKPEAKAFKRWVTHEVIPSIRKTGRYEVQASAPHLPRSYADALRELAETVERAEAAETVVKTIEDNRGLNLRKYHKTYFPDVAERAFFDLLYSSKLLIDQRKSRWNEKKKEWVDGYQHMNPTYTGKPYFYMTGPTIEGHRRTTTRVRPGQPEADLRNLLIRKGLPAADTKELVA